MMNSMRQGIRVARWQPRLRPLVAAHAARDSGRPVVVFHADISDLVGGVIHVARDDGQQAADDETDEPEPPYELVAARRAPTGDRERGKQQQQRQRFCFQFLIHGALAYLAKTTNAIVAAPVRTATMTVHGMVRRRTAPSWPLAPPTLVPSTMLAGAIALP